MLKNLVTDDFGSFFFPKHAKKDEKDLWLDKYKPELLSESAVHKNKILELETCLQKMFSKKASILLLSGPSGSAKTTTLQLIAKKLNLDVQEWANSISDEFHAKNDEFVEERIFGESQQNKFSDFLFRASRYDSLCFNDQQTGVHKISIVKDFPNFLWRDPTKLKELLLKYNKMSIINPLVFIVTDTEQSSSIKRKLFPANMITELGVEVIKFNPIAPTCMMKALQRIANVACQAQPSKQELEEIVQQSNGDVRSACNFLQFLCTRSKRLKKPKKAMKEKKPSFSKKKPSGPSLEQAAVGSKDVGISLFRVLGKILHCKRLPDTTSNLPEHLKHHHRAPMSFDPDTIFDKSCLSVDLFISFLHQNYPSFTASLEEMSSASEAFSEADSLCKEWSARERMLPYQASLVTRGVMFSPLPSSSSKPAWMPLHKPQMLSITSKSLELSHSIHDNFSSTLQHCNHTQLCTELLPFLSLINRHSNQYSNFKNLKNPKSHPTTPTFNPHQRQILHNISHFNQSSRLERFDEKDALDIETTASPSPEEFHLATDSSNATSHPNHDRPSEDLESLIEEYDSDDD